MKGVQCYELFGGIALKIHTFSFFYIFILPVLLKQKKAIRIIARAKYHDHTEKLFHNMKLLTVNQIIELQSLTFMYNAFKRLTN